MTGASASRPPGRGDALERAIHAAARGLALAAMALLALLVVLVVASITGRALFDRPIPGDFELVEMGTAIAVFLCLPYAQLARSHVVVDIFFSSATSPTRAVLERIADVVVGLLALLLAWRMAAGMVDAVALRNISVMLGLPLWWAYPFAVASFLLLAAVCALAAGHDPRGRR